MVGSNMFKWFISFRGLLGPIFRGIFTLFVSGSVKCSWFLGGISVPKITDVFWKVIAGDEMTWQVIVSPKNVESFPFSYAKRHGKNQFGYASLVYSMFLQKLPAYRIFAHQRYRCIPVTIAKRKISRIPWIYRISRLQNMMGFHAIFLFIQTQSQHSNRGVAHPNYHSNGTSLVGLVSWWRCWRTFL